MAGPYIRYATFMLGIATACTASLAMTKKG